MKGCYSIFIHYFRVLALFAVPLLFIGSGMAFVGPVRIGNIVLEAGPWTLVGAAFVGWIVIAARVMRKH